MSAGKWTKGPWTVCPSYRNEYTKRVPVKVGSAPAITIAETLGAPKGDVADANAALIAAAPEMAEALERLIDVLNIAAIRHKGATPAEAEAVRLGADALRKARGEES